MKLARKYAIIFNNCMSKNDYRIFIYITDLTEINTTIGGIFICQVQYREQSYNNRFGR